MSAEKYAFVIKQGLSVFGNLPSNLHDFTGSVAITGSLRLNGEALLVSSQTSSIMVVSSSYASASSQAVTSSYALTASYAANVPLTASYALTASYYGGTVIYVRRNDFSGSYSYYGSAISGSLTSDPVWNITRIYVSSSGDAESKYAYSAIWDNRYITIYN